MKITNIEKGKNFQLEKGAQLEIERTNPFFNDYGEQSIPMDLPASPYNCQLLGYPEQFGHRGKSQPIDVHIQDGEYSSACRMALLSAQRNASLSVSFYMNDGSFYSRIQDKRLKDIFGDEQVEGVYTVDQAIEFCRKLRKNTNDRFACFPVLVTDDSGTATGGNYKCINGYGYDDSSYGFVISEGSSCDFFGAKERSEYVGGNLIRLAKGYYISPFIRANYVLQRVFQFFGYTLEDNFFSQTMPFQKMVLANNVIDTIVNGYIKLSDLVPDVSVGDFINMYRKRFCCEFVADEGKRMVSVKMFRDILTAAPAADLGNTLVGHPEFSFNQDGDFKRIVLKTDEKVSSEVEDGYDNIKDLQKSNLMFFVAEDGSIRKHGYTYRLGGMYDVYTKVAEASMDYNTGEDEMEEEEISIPDMLPELRKLVITYTSGNVQQTFENSSWLYVGDYRTLHSKIVMDAAASNSDNSEDGDKQFLMLAFPTVDTDGRACGTISEYLPVSDFIWSNLNVNPLWDYGLQFYGKRGIYEKFWRDYDNLLRNALQPVKAKFLLSQSQKQNLPAHGKVVVNGVPLFIDKLKFALGGDTEPQESELLTINVEEPANYAITPEKMFPSGFSYYWRANAEYQELTKEQYDNADDKDAEFTVVYPPIPSVSYTGKRQYVQTSARKMIDTIIIWNIPRYSYMRITFWLECIKY
jgi:hypothetical protein